MVWPQGARLRVYSGYHAPKTNNSSIHRPINMTGPQPANENPTWQCPETFKTLPASVHEIPRVKQSSVYKQEREGRGSF